MVYIEQSAMLVLRLVGVVGPVLLLLSQVMQDPVKSFIN
jgi:hypothetical protein